MPEAAPPVSTAEVASWVAPTRPAGHRLYRYRWLYRDDRSSIGGRGTARVAPPDSVRLDVGLALGVGSGAGVVVGDSTLWGRPADLLARFVPNYELMWAMFGVARQPPAGARITGTETGTVRAWRYVAEGDTIAYRLTSGDDRRLEAEVRRGGDVLGRVETSFGAAGLPAGTRLTIPRGPARLDITFESIDSVAAFPPDLWTAGEP